MYLNVGSERKNLEFNFENKNLSEHGSSIKDSIKLQDENSQDEFFTENINISDSESNISSESNFSESPNDKLDFVEKTRIFLPLSIEIKDANAFLKKNKSFNTPKNQTEVLLKHNSDYLPNFEKKKVKKKNINNIKKKVISIELEGKEKKQNRKPSLCCCLQTGANEKNINFTENQIPESGDIMEVKSQNTRVDELFKQKSLEEKLESAKKNHHKIYKIYPKIEFDKKPRLDETKPNIVNVKSPKSKSLENIYKIFEYKINIEIPKFNNSMNLGFLSKRFEEKEINKNKPILINLPNFNEKTISEIISDTLSWYEMYKLNKIRKLEDMLNG
ncbi:uncharacterized protein ELE39_001705 [Cryptosporidium sp. chipmunk genotype I]|uniref:uncharacterized protein n=1 Tax=Cryptosporidium sp. chipmunk genotype I TaxID=1280935 RepID=UPI00351A8CCC|nr:hypothetical protein ELE39_001705 [Cryptosporidium sp. chipmunk genotype I]